MAPPVEEPAAALARPAASYARAWREHFSQAHEPIRLLGERNVFRYRPCRGVLVRGEAATPAGRLALEQVLLAARTCGVPVTVSLAAGEPGPWLDGAPDVSAVVETEAELIARLGGAGVERLRALVPISRELRDGGARGGDRGARRARRAPRADSSYATTCASRAVSRVVHRYGSVMQLDGAG